METNENKRQLVENATNLQYQKNSIWWMCTIIPGGNLFLSQKEILQCSVPPINIFYTSWHQYTPWISILSLCSAWPTDCNFYKLCLTNTLQLLQYPKTKKKKMEKIDTMTHSTAKNPSLVILANNAQFNILGESMDKLLLQFLRFISLNLTSFLSHLPEQITETIIHWYSGVVME